MSFVDVSVRVFPFRLVCLTTLYSSAPPRLERRSLCRLSRNSFIFVSSRASSRVGCVVSFSGCVVVSCELLRC